MSDVTCRICTRPCRYLILDKTRYALLPGYCEEHGASMLRPMENSTVTEVRPSETCGVVILLGDGRSAPCALPKWHEAHWSATPEATPEPRVEGESK